MKVWQAAREVEKGGLRDLCFAKYYLSVASMCCPEYAVCKSLTALPLANRICCDHSWSDLGFSPEGFKADIDFSGRLISISKDQITNRGCSSACQWVSTYL